MKGVDRVAHQAAADPNAHAVILEDRTVSWGELDSRVTLTALRMAGRGVAPGDRIVMTLDPGLEAFETMFAANRLGAVVVPLSPKTPESEIDPLISQVAPRLFVQPGALDGLPPAETMHRRTPDDEDPVCIIFTSGSEGAPRGVVLTENNWSASNHASAQRLRLLPGDRWVACLPINHVGGYAIPMRAAETGFAVVPVAEFDTAAVIDAVARTSATAISLVPTMLSRLLDEGWQGASGLRFVLLGGGPCPESLVHEALDRRIPIALTYGLTEACSQVATLPPWDARGRLTTVGTPLPGVQVRVADAPDRPGARGTPGQIWVSGSTIATHTLTGKLPSTHGWYATGDLGTLDDSAFLTMLGRIDDLILTGGEKVVPLEVESALLTDPNVAEAAVFGVPDDEWGQRAIAAVVLAPGASGTDAAALRGRLKKELMYHKVPRRVMILEELPYIGPDKIDKAALREMAKSTADDNDITGR